MNRRMDGYVLQELSTHCLSCRIPRLAPRSDTRKICAAAEKNVWVEQARHLALHQYKVIGGRFLLRKARWCDIEEFSTTVCHII